MREEIEEWWKRKNRFHRDLNSLGCEYRVITTRPLSYVKNGAAVAFISPSVYFTERLVRFSNLQRYCVNCPKRCYLTINYRHIGPSCSKESSHTKVRLSRSSESSAKSFMALAHTHRQRYSICLGVED